MPNMKRAYLTKHNKFSMAKSKFSFLNSASSKRTDIAIVKNKNVYNDQPLKYPL